MRMTRGDQQMQALADQLRAAIMLKYNKRKLGWGRGGFPIGFTIGKSAAGKKGGGNGMRPAPALTRAPAPQPDSSDEEWERLIEQGNQGK